MRYRAFALSLALLIVAGVVAWPRNGSAAPTNHNLVPVTFPP
jgi:hypothetical protein